MYTTKMRRDISSIPPSMHSGEGGEGCEVVEGGEGGEGGICNCQVYLDPFPAPGTFSWRCGLHHYCRVCNTQLNSCKQTRIHVEGKKHEKRLSHLKYSLENTDNSTPIYQTGLNGLNGLNPHNGILNPVGQVSSIISTGLPTHIYTYPPPCPTYQSAAYYYPPTSIPTYSYPCTEYNSQPSPPTQQQQQRGRTNHATTTTHGVMSPSLTSGFSGSGDCKSTETCSLASYSSTPHPLHQSAESSESQTEQHSPIRGTSSQHTATRHTNLPRVSVEESQRVSCKVCNVSFPSSAVLHHHIIGSRHIKKVRALRVFRELQENGVEFRAQEPTGDIRCEVCEVSVNSSHQLQAHMSGHKHKARCSRQGVKPSQAVISPSTRLLTPGSSTAPSSTPSEASAPVRTSSILVGRPKFGSRPNLYSSSRHSSTPRQRFTGLQTTKSRRTSTKLSQSKSSGVKVSTSKSSGLKVSATKWSGVKVSATARMSSAGKLSNDNKMSGSLRKSTSSNFKSRVVLRKNQSRASTENYTETEDESSGGLVDGKDGTEHEEKDEKDEKDKKEVEEEKDIEEGVCLLNQKENEENQKDRVETKQVYKDERQNEDEDEGEDEAEEDQDQDESDIMSDEAKESAGDCSPGLVKQNDGLAHGSQEETSRRLNGSSRRVSSSNPGGSSWDQGGRMWTGRDHGWNEGERISSTSNLTQSRRKYQSCFSLNKKEGENRQTKSTGELQGFWCTVCQISLNSKSQMSQHQSSSRHQMRQFEQSRGKQAVVSRGVGGGVGGGGGVCGGFLYPPPGCQHSAQLDVSQHYLPKVDRVLRDIPMLNMFLQRLQQHHYFPPIRDEEEVVREEGR